MGEFRTAIYVRIEIGIQPNCSEATVRIITDKLSKGELESLKQALRNLEKNENIFYDTSWDEDELHDTRGIVISGDGFYNHAGEILDELERVAGGLEYDSRGEELMYGCSYSNFPDEDGDTTCYECEAKYCPIHGPYPGGGITEVKWRRCLKCGRNLYFFEKESMRHCLWKPCNFKEKPVPERDIAIMIAEKLKGNAE